MSLPNTDRITPFGLGQSPDLSVPSGSMAMWSSRLESNSAPGHGGLSGLPHGSAISLPMIPGMKTSGFFGGEPSRQRSPVQVPPSPPEEPGAPAW